MNYNQYTVADFLLDESFQDWVLLESAGQAGFWADWVAAHPEKAGLVNEAVQLLRQLPRTEKELPAAQVEAAWAELQRALQEQRLTIRPVTTTPGWFTAWRQLAAVLVGLLLLAGGYWLIHYRLGTQVYVTQFGETRTITLPDQSTVVLNGNSRLSYPRYWPNHQAREVWLDGEAYFSVTHQTGPPAGNAKFRVNTDDLRVEVLGTQFNVARRRNKTNVVLSAGKVQLTIKNRTKTTRLVMAPGESIEYQKQADTIVKKAVNPALYTSWKNKKLIFDNTPLREVAARLENTYGLPVIVADTSQLSRQLTGTIPTENLDLLLLALAKSYQLNIEKQSGRILIK